jgi:hypothetical protein
MILIRSAALILTLLLLPVFAEAQTRARRNLEIEWEDIEGATGYEVQVTRKVGDKKPIRYRTKIPKWSANIKPGLYNMQIRSYDDRGVPGDWSPPSELLVRLPSVVAIAPEGGKVMQAVKQKDEPIEFRWEAVPNAVKYKVKVKSTTSDWTFEKAIEDTALTIDVPAGEMIQWEVYAINDKNEDGDAWEKPLAFELRGPQLLPPTIEKPLTKYVKEVKWAPSEHSKSYSYDLKYFNEKTGKWDIVESKRGYGTNVAAMDITRPSGKYRIQVQAIGERRKNSAVQQLDFEMRGGFREPAALEKAILRESISKPTNFYAIASYLLTQVSYSQANYDQGQRATFDAVGGTGRLGAGYQEPESKWGGFGIVDLGGFTIGGQNFTFASMEMHVTRKLEFGQGGLLLFGAGLFSKELPVVQGSSLAGYQSTGKVRNVGPHAGFTYWTPLNDRLGLQLNGRIYYTVMGAAESGEVQSSMSMQYGLLGSYRLSSDWMGYAGYAYRADEAAYSTNPSDASSFAQPGEVNTVNMEGHYLNLILEFSF